MTSYAEKNPLLLYDGVCGFCNKSVQMILAKDKRGTMQFAPLQSTLGKEIVARHRLEHIDSVVFVDRSAGKEEIAVRSTAALKIADYLGGWWRLLAVFKIVPRPLRDFFYDLFAKYRYRFFGKHESCMLPAPEVRARFIDMA